ncbi:MAG: aminoglycoside phosphotransferase family protein [Candidatus Latescibacterota bacterium]
MQSLISRPGWRLDVRDPLYAHLAFVVLPRAGVEVTQPDFEVGELGNGRGVYVYRERTSHALFVCKFFGSRHHLSESARRALLHLEFSNLSVVREMGFKEFPYRMVQPLSKSEPINCVLVEEFARGHDLDYYISKAAYEGQHKRLFGKLTQLAHFLAELHNCTVDTERVRSGDAFSYFRHLVSALVRAGVVGPQTADRFSHLSNKWEKDSQMWTEPRVLVHGDVTPTNFLFHVNEGVTAIDLERMRMADRVYDVGMLAAELRHHFAWRVGQAGAAEPFIGHFLWAYCEGFPDQKRAFREVSHRNRFYMALGELRMARNPWLPWEHRKWLVQEAVGCLQ